MRIVALSVLVGCGVEAMSPEAVRSDPHGVLPPPLGALDLSASEVSPGLPFTLTAVGEPRDRVTFLASVRGDGGGPCPPALLGGACVDVESPLILGTVTAGPDGVAAITRTFPADVAADTLWFQAAVAAGADASISPVVVVAVTGPAEPERLQVRLELDLEFSGPSAGLACLFAGVCDCTATYLGDGELVERDGDRFTFDGSWVQSRSTCGDGVGLEDQVWAGPDGLAYHTLVLTDRLTEWVVHDDPAAFAPDPSAAQFAVEGIDEPWTGAPIAFSGVTVESELGVTATVTSDITLVLE